MKFHHMGDQTKSWIGPFVHSVNKLGVSKGKSFLNFFQPHLILATMLSSTQPAALIISPK